MLLFLCRTISTSEGGHFSHGLELKRDSDTCLRSRGIWKKRGSISNVQASDPVAVSGQDNKLANSWIWETGNDGIMLFDAKCCSFKHAYVISDVRVVAWWVARAKLARIDLLVSNLVNRAAGTCQILLRVNATRAKTIEWPEPVSSSCRLWRNWMAIHINQTLLILLSSWATTTSGRRLAAAQVPTSFQLPRGSLPSRRRCSGHLRPAEDIPKPPRELKPRLRRSERLGS